MARSWLEKVTGSMEQKRRYRRNRARARQLPASYRTAYEAVERYLLHSGGVSDGEVAVAMLEDLADLVEESAANGTPIRQVVGDDPVEFAETFLRNYSSGQWADKERRRLAEAIDRAADDEPDDGTPR